MRYVVTGATSFLGVEICKYLLNAHNEVYAVCRNGSNKTQNLPQDSLLHVVFADMCDYGHLDKIISRADVFINLAWEGTGHSGRNLTDIQKDNIRNTSMAMHTASNMGCTLFVESGSQAEYGTTFDKISENTPCNPFSEYGKAKLEVMKNGYAFAKKTGMKYLHLRIFSLYGETDHLWTLIMSSLDKMKRNEPVDLSSCQQNWNFLHVKDAAKQICKLCNYAIGNADFRYEIFNIASEDTRQLQAFVCQIKELTHSSSQLNFGVYKPEKIVSLDPDVSKVKAAIGFIADHQFENDIISIFNLI